MLTDNLPKSRVGGGKIDSLFTENLLTGTRDQSDNWYKDGEYMGFAVAHKKTAGSEQYSDIISHVLQSYESGATYTFSFFAKGQGIVQCYFYSGLAVKSGINSAGGLSGAGDGRTELLLSPDWKQYWIQWTLDEGDASVRKKIAIRSNPGNDVYACAPKLEPGANSNPIWTPNPDEVIFTKSELKTYLDEYMKTIGG